MACVCWFTSTQKCVNLSTYEAKYVALGNGSWLKGPGKIVARLGTVDLISPQFQMAVRCHYDFMSAEGDHARVMKGIQRMVEHLRRLNSFSGLVFQRATGND